MVEGREPVTREAQRHLGQCPQCFAAYAEAVEHRSAWLQDPEASALQHPRGLKGTAGGRRSAPDTPAPGGLSRMPGSVWAAALVAACALAVALGIWLRGTPEKKALPDLAYAPVIQAAVNEYSARGLILPGGENAAADDLPEYRGETSSRSESLDRAIRALHRAYERNPDSAGVGVELVAANLAAENLSVARTLTREQLRTHPRDPRVQVLAAIVAYQDDDLQEADRHLQSALDEFPDYGPARLNRALVLVRMGRLEEAKSILREVAGDHPRQPLGRRAERILSDKSVFR